MDFPLFYLDLIGNRLMLAIIAITHVLINHPLAVGAYPLVVFMEWWGQRTKNPEWDQLAYRVTFVLFIITTSIGALTGVGIWLSAGLISPFGIGSLLRVFFWAWFTEWLVFISEVVLIVLYFLLWKRWTAGSRRKLHLAVGVILSVMSWFTMAIIVGILGFMMGTGSWTTDHTLFSAFLNPLYLPQLAFRTAYALMAGGLTVWFLMFFFTKKGTEFRQKAVRLVASWSLILAPICAAGALWYWSAVPTVMKNNLDVGMLTQNFQQWHQTFLIVIAVVIGVILLVGLTAVIRPKLIPSFVLIIPFVFGLYLLGHFERVREFIRKPHVVANYMYSNGVTMDELPVFQRDGLLRYATYVRNHQVTSTNKISAGQDVFMIACSRCHTTGGVNSVVKKFRKLYGDGEWSDDAMGSFLATMHVTRQYMPPFPGNDAEAEALVAFIKDLKATGRTVTGVQMDGIPQPPPEAVAPEATARLQGGNNDN